MMLILEKSNKHFSKFIELLKNQSELKINDVKKIVSHSSYYAIIIQKIYNINKILREFNPNIYLAEPTFSMTQSKQVFSSIKRCDLIEIETKQDFFIIKFNDKN